MQNDTPLLNAGGAPGRRSYVYPANDVPLQDITSLIPEAAVRRQAAALPELSELEVVRHFTNLSRRNHAVDVGFYPLGSCTMKYNPKVNEAAAALPGMARIHPYQSAASVQGALALMWNLQQILCELSGLDYATLQPAAGAHGELTGMMIIKAFHVEHGADAQRTEVIIPDSGHGTNPATAAMCGYKVVTVRSNERGGIDLAALRQAVGPQTAALMVTNPNTLGLFDENIAEIAAIIHGAGGKLYYDGANANAILGISRPGDMGFDVVHFNLHKTFATPHGGGGPGAGPVVVSAELAPYLPVPVVMKDGDVYRLDYERPESIGQVKAFFGNFAVLVRAYVYICGLGAAGLREVSETAVLHANYLMRRLEAFYDLPYNRLCKHEFVLSGRRQKAQGVRTLDIAKRLLDYGMHSPTVYFPLIVEEAIMVEPTETESLAEMDHFADIMEQIAQEAVENPDALHAAPHTTPVGRLDETRAARQPNLRWPSGGAGGCCQ